MEPEKLRRKICFAAAQLLNSRQETSFVRARWRATRSITNSYVSSDSIPTDMEIRMALQQLVSDSVPDCSQTAVDVPSSHDLPQDRFHHYHQLLAPLDRVRLDRDTHPEGDLLYHSLQVFELAKDARPWDEEFLTAALLHEVGRGIDPFDAHQATLCAVQTIVSERTYWFIEQLPTQHRSREGTIGARARRRLSQHEDGEDLRLLAECDSEGRVPGRQTGSLQEALEQLRSLSME